MFRTSLIVHIIYTISTIHLFLGINTINNLGLVRVSSRIEAVQVVKQLPYVVSQTKEENVLELSRGLVVQCPQGRDFQWEYFTQIRPCQRISATLFYAWTLKLVAKYVFSMFSRHEKGRKVPNIETLVGWKTHCLKKFLSLFQTLFGLTTIWPFGEQIFPKCRFRFRTS